MSILPKLLFSLVFLAHFVSETRAFLSVQNCVSCNGWTRPFQHDVPATFGYKPPGRSYSPLYSNSEASDDFAKDEIEKWEPELTQYKSVADLDLALSQMSPEHAEAYLHKCWSVFNSTGGKEFLPTPVTYTSVITAWARSKERKRAAKRSEQLLDEMEYLRHEHPHLAPTTPCVNAVLNAWSQSLVRGASKRCEEILERMERLSTNRTELAPDIITYNTVLLAMSRERGQERRAEELLLEIENRSSCQPDILSYNTVIRGWAQSREHSASRRAEALLRQMERRYESNSTLIAPDVTTYTTVIHAWAKRNEEHSADRAESVLNRMEQAYRNGNKLARPNAITYNSIINVWSKSNDTKAGEHAMEVLSLMKKLYRDEGRSDCRPDSYTYTSVIDALAKGCSSENVLQAERLLEEAQEEYQRTGDTRIKPNVRTYTSVINAIGRSRENPERAEALLNQMEERCELGESDVRPDVVCYNAALNSWGWSNEKNKGLNAYNLYRKMLENYESGKYPDAKPDIITCNSVLNACSFDRCDNEADRAEVMKVVSLTLEEFQSAAPKFGRPNHLTYGNVLSAISKHLPMNNLRLDMAEATFWQCCQAGQISALVVTELRKAVTEEKFAYLMGPAVTSKPGETIRFNIRKLPRQWTKYAPRVGYKRTSRPSRKRLPSKITQQRVRENVIET